MNAKSPQRPHPPMITLGDIYYILFRHKWKIMVISIAGLLIGSSLPLIWPKSYQSEAKLLVKYVVNDRLPSDANGNEQAVTLPDSSGRNIINTELQILTSLDLANEVATNVGSVKVLGKNGDVLVAAAVIHNNLTVEVPPTSDVIRIVFKHRDPVVVVQVLQQVIDSYLSRHAEIHQPGGAYDEFLTKQTDLLKTQLSDTENKLRAVKTNLNIVSLEDSQRVFGEQMRKIQQDIFDADAELAEHQATVSEISKHTKSTQAETNQTAVSETGTNQALAAQTGTNQILASQTGTNQVGTNQTLASQTGTNTIAKVADTNAPSAEKITEYKHVTDMLERFRSREKELLVQFLPENSQVKDVQGQIVSLEKQKKQMEKETPNLIAKKIAEANAAAPQTVSDEVWENSLITEQSRIAALQRKIEVLTGQLAYIQGRAGALDANAGTITDLERTRKVEDDQFRRAKQALDNSHVQEAFGLGKNSNINTIQSPSPPYLDNSKMKKASMGIMVAGIFIGIGLAFLIELYIDHTLKRPADIEARLGVPLFLSIPYRNGKGKNRLLNEPPKSALALRSETLNRTVPLNGTRTTIGRQADNLVIIDEGSISQHHCEIFSRNGEVIVKDLGSTNGTSINGERIVEATLKLDQTLRIGNVDFHVESQETVKDLVVAPKTTDVTPPWDPRHALRPFYDTLRDRLITYFEVKNLTHNPKLVALTSCGDRAGVTSTAAGLAAALSETGEGNVLLVDMNVERGAAHHFYKGHLSCGIDEALVKEKRHEARVQDNLYVVTESTNEDSLPRVLPKRFNSLVTKLKASDYDYIIFDMPPMSQISITPRLARYMDMVMVVVESEKTDRDVVQRAVTMLTETRANVGIVLNKRKQYVPQRIQQEL